MAQSNVPNFNMSRTLNALQNKKPWEQVAPLMSQDLNNLQDSFQKVQGKVFGGTPAVSTPLVSAPVVVGSTSTAVNGITGEVQIVGHGVSTQPGTSNIIIQPNAGGVLVNSPASISNIAETAGSIVTLTLAPSPFMQVGSSVYLSGLSVGTWLNTQTVTLSSVTGTGIVFSDPTAHGTQASAAETGLAYVTDIPAVTAHSGGLIPFTGAAAATYTLANPALKNGWWVGIQAVGAGGVTISPNSLNLDGSGSNLAVVQHKGCLLFADGIGYWSMRGIS
jgi:hypothetical protein